MTETQATRFRGKVAFVTGGSKGIGTGIVRRLASEDASVAFTSRTQRQPRLNSCKSSNSKGSTALVLKADRRLHGAQRNL
jgi:3-oxoacyl-[acyl-carrier protein] reductase